MNIVALIKLRLWRSFVFMNIVALASTFNSPWVFAPNLPRRDKPIFINDIQSGTNFPNYL